MSSATGSYDSVMAAIFANVMEDLSHFEDTGVDGCWFYGMLFCRECHSLAGEAYSGEVPLSEIRCGTCGASALMKVGAKHWKRLGGI